MQFNIITLFPEFFSGPLSSGLMQRAVQKGIVAFNFKNPREEAADKRQTVDDRPYGGGPGMVMLLEPLVKSLQSLGFEMHPAADEFSNLDTNATAACANEAGVGTKTRASAGQSGIAKNAEQALSAQPMDSAAKQEAPMVANEAVPPAEAFGASQAAHVPQAVAQPALLRPGRLLAMSPKGRPFDQAFAAELAREERVTILCGRYEGYDARLNELFPVEEVSMGDFVLNGGETAALAVCEATSRLLPGFMGHEDSGVEESFSNGLLEYPHFTRPEVYGGLTVPDVLRSGDHGAVDKWRRVEALRATLKARPELLEKASLSAADMAFVRSIPRYLPSKNLYVALVHYPVLDKDKKSVAVSLTNLDVHDISRSSCSYGLGGFFVVQPVADQRKILEEVLAHWLRGAGSQSNPDRKKAFSKVIPVDGIADAVAYITEKHGEKPLVWGSSAQGNGTITFDEARKILYTRPALFLLGTSHGLAPEVTEKCDHLLPPLRWAAEYNHLSVRCAGTLLMDRILGEWG